MTGGTRALIIRSYATNFIAYARKIGEKLAANGRAFRMRAPGFLDGTMQMDWGARTSSSAAFGVSPTASEPFSKAH